MPAITTAALSFEVHEPIRKRVGAERAGVFEGDNILKGNNQQLQSTRDDDVGIWITRPSNDDVLYLGNMVLEFETRGFTSEEFPIEVGLNHV